MDTFSREEVEASFRDFVEMGDRCAETGDWNPWADIHSEDGLWIEHHLGTQRGRDEIRRVICEVMKPVPMMFFPVEWFMIEGNRVVSYIWQQMPDPKGGREVYRFGNITVLEYAGGGLWSFQEDVYNPVEAQEMMKRWMAAGGVLAPAS